MSELSKDKILEYFGEINQKLIEIGKHGEIIIAGGAALAVAFNARNSTRDIDAIFRPSEVMRKIIKNIAEEHGLPEDWLNDGVKGFITEKMKREKYLSLSNLDVYNIDAAGLLAMKLTSARIYAKDMEDSIFLMKLLDIKEIVDLFDIIAKYIHPNQQTVSSKYFTITAFSKYKGEMSDVCD